MSDETTTVTDIPDPKKLVIERLVIWYFLAALTYLTISMLGGLLMALQLINHNPLAGIEIFSPGRWRMRATSASSRSRSGSYPR